MEYVFVFSIMTVILKLVISWWACLLQQQIHQKSLV